MVLEVAVWALEGCDQEEPAVGVVVADVLDTSIWSATIVSFS